ncbi:aminotransferase class IV [Micrococcus sp.]|uniref:aminotransferase class IV n=1 Tax=Micrococcus sp. TaxID=1271 RepID=UPI002A912092|nr:aminotransferase class IV [Micrococcus sp.]MDY6054899.1 aminotransferase class IV [Micrococcus sp.]
MADSPAPAAAPVLVLIDDDGGPRLADPAAPHLPVTDQGATRGDGLFETALAVVGRDGVPVVRKLGAHLARLASSAQALDLPVPGAERWEAAVRLGLEAWADGARTADAGTAGARPVPGSRASVRLTATRGPEVPAGQPVRPTCWVLVTAVPAPDPARRRAGVSVLLLERGLDSRVVERAPWLLTGAKTLSYAVNMAALRHARAQGADDAVFTSADGYLLEGPTSTVLIARRTPQGRRALVTPLRQKGILAGTSQSVIFAAAEAEGWELGYGPLVPADLEGIDGMWLVSSVRGVMPVREVDGRALPVDPALTDLLQAWLDADADPGRHTSGDPLPEPPAPGR